MALTRERLDELAVLPGTVVVHVDAELSLARVLGQVTDVAV